MTLLDGKMPEMTKSLLKSRVLESSFWNWSAIGTYRSLELMKLDRGAVGVVSAGSVLGLNVCNSAPATNGVCGERLIEGSVLGESKGCHSGPSS